MVLKFSSVEKKIQNTLCSARKINKKELYHFTQTWRNDRYTFEDETPESLLMRTTSVSQKKKQHLCQHAFATIIHTVIASRCDAIDECSHLTALQLVL